MIPLALRAAIGLHLARAVDWCARTLFPSEPPRLHKHGWHPADGPRVTEHVVPMGDNMPPLTEQEAELVARLRSYRDYLTCCELYDLPAYDKEETR